MRYYKDTSGNVYVYSDIQTPKDGLVPLSQQELGALLNPPANLEEARRAQVGKINRAFALASAALIGGYPQEERLTWPIQQDEALAWAQNEETPTPFLDSIAAARQIDAVAMRQYALSNVQAFLVASAQLIGKRQRLRDAVESAQKLSDIQSIVWEDDE